MHLVAFPISLTQKGIFQNIRNDVWLKCWQFHVLIFLVPQFQSTKLNTRSLKEYWTRAAPPFDRRVHVAQVPATPFLDILGACDPDSR